MITRRASSADAARITTDGLVHNDYYRRPERPGTRDAATRTCWREPGRQAILQLVAASIIRLRTLIAVAFALLLGASLNARPALAQQGGSIPEAGRCWRFAFSAWDPPLDWERAGHEGRADDVAGRVRRVRDSVFVRDSAAARNAAMHWERTARGLAVVLFPTWWPVGVHVEFYSIAADGREMSGRATALVADENKPPSRARARAVRCPAD